jgi:hypothetical protein
VAAKLSGAISQASFLIAFIACSSGPMALLSNRSFPRRFCNPSTQIAQWILTQNQILGSKRCNVAGFWIAEA